MAVQRCLSCGESSDRTFCGECEPNFEGTVRVATARQLLAVGALPIDDFDPESVFCVQAVPEQDEPLTAFIWRKGKDFPDAQMSREAFDALPLARSSA